MLAVDRRRSADALAVRHSEQRASCTVANAAGSPRPAESRQDGAARSLTALARSVSWKGGYHSSMARLEITMVEAR